MTQEEFQEAQTQQELPESQIVFDPEILHPILKGLKDRASKFTSPFNTEVKQNNRIYEDIPSSLDLSVDNMQRTRAMLRKNKRLPSFVVFQSVESAKASLLDKLFNIVVKFRGGTDDDVRGIVENVIRYIEKQGGFEDIQIKLAHQYLLHGFVSAHATISDNPREDEDVDPTIKVHEPSKTYFSADTEPNETQLDVPFVISEVLLSPSKIKRLYGVEHEASDATTDSPDKQGNRVKCYVFMGECEYEDEYYQIFSVFSDKKVIHVSEIEGQVVRTASLFRRQEKVFGFGLAQLLQTHQAEKSIRRAQQIKAANKLAYSKWLIPKGQTIDKNDLINDDVDAVISYDSDPKMGGKPEVAKTPEMNPIVIQENERLDQEIQKIPGLFELSTGNNSTVVKTATGQSIFSESTEKLVKLRRRPLATMYLNLMIDCLKLAQANWTINKTVTVADPDTGEETEATINIERFKAIDLDKDVEIDVESAQFNRDIVKAQQIDMFNTLKDIPGIDIRVLAEQLIKNGYEEKNPARYFRKNGLQEGAKLIDQATGQIYVVDKFGQVNQPEVVANTPEAGDTSGTTPSEVSQIL